MKYITSLLLLICIATPLMYSGTIHGYVRRYNPNPPPVLFGADCNNAWVVYWKLPYGTKDSVLTDIETCFESNPVSDGTYHLMAWKIIDGEKWESTVYTVTVEYGYGIGEPVMSNSEPN